MSKRKYNLEEIRKARESWKPLNIDALPPIDRAAYIRKKKALDMYIDGVPIRDIEAETGVNRSCLIKYVKRSVMANDHGEYYGYSILTSYIRVKVKDTGTAGSFNKLLERYPELRDFIIGNYTGDKKYTLEKNMNYVTLSQKFQEKCRQLGVQDFEYPFNTKDKGYNALIRFIKNEEKKNITTITCRSSKDAAQKFLSTGTGTVTSICPVAPYQLVQVDGHKLDIEYTVETFDSHGMPVNMTAMRPWLFVLIDTASRCILGYSITQSEEYNQFDVLKAFRHAILPKSRVKFTLPGLAYPENGGFPDTAMPEIQYPMIGAVMLDNAMSHLAKNTVEKLVDVLNAEVCFGSVATPEARGIVERFFQTLEKCGLHKLPVTTGSNATDPKRNDPGKAAVRYAVTFNDIEQIIEWLIVLYNNSSNSSINNDTPINRMRSRIMDSRLYPVTRMDAASITSIQRLTYFSDTRRVNASRKNGKRPYINYMGAVYRSDRLSYNMEYEGRTLTLGINPDNIRYIDAYDENGIFIDTLHATGSWGNIDHSYQVRMWANKLSADNKEKNDPFRPPVHALEEELSKRGRKDRRARTKAAQVRKSSGIQEPSEQKEREAATPVIPIDRGRETPPDKPMRNDVEFIKKAMDEMTPEEVYRKYKDLFV